MTQPVDSLVQQWAVTPSVRAAAPRLLSVQVAYATVPVALVETGPGEVELRAHWIAPPQLAADRDALAGLAARTTFARAGQLRCVVVDGAIDVAYPVYLDGLTRTAFYDAAMEVAKTAVSIDEAARGAAGTVAPGGAAGTEGAAAADAAAGTAAPVPMPIDEPDDLPEPESLPASDAGDGPVTQAMPAPLPAEPEAMPAVMPEPALEPSAGHVPEEETTASPAVPQPVMYSPPGQQAAQPQAGVPEQQQPAADFQPPMGGGAAQPAAASAQPVQAAPPVQPVQAAPPVQSVQQPQQPQWAPTHTVPPGGVPAWAAPDPTQPPASHLPQGLPVRLVERQGGWARIDAENGWTGWVDGRPLPDPPAA